jgi:hypothetical protein
MIGSGFCNCNEKGKVGNVLRHQELSMRPGIVYRFATASSFKPCADGWYSKAFINKDSP